MRRLVVLAVMVVASLACPLSPANAGDGFLLLDVSGDSAGFTHAPDEPLLEVPELAPGYSGSSDFAVRNSSVHGARLLMSVDEVVDRENGCLPQEAREEGVGCDADGELSGALVVTIDRADQPTTPLWRGPFRDLINGVELTQDLPGGSTWPLRVTVTLPWESTNATMSDTVSFATRLTAESDDGYSVVSSPGQSIGANAAHGGTGGTAHLGASTFGALAAGPQVALPMTGGAISLWMLMLDVSVLLLGCLLVVWSRRRPSPVQRRSRA